MPRRAALALILLSGVLSAHDIITTKITWDREISRIVYARCASCHRPDGAAFSLMTYVESRPWAKAMQEEVLERRMPPWGAVRGFADYRDDPALTPEQLELIAQWVDGGAPEGDEKDLPPPPKIEAPAPVKPARGIAVSGDFVLKDNLLLDGVQPAKVPEKATFQVIAELPDGRIEPLLWLLPFQPAYAHAFILKNPLRLPRGTRIRGVPQGAQILLLPAHSG